MFLRTAVTAALFALPAAAQQAPAPGGAAIAAETLKALEAIMPPQSEPDFPAEGESPPAAVDAPPPEAGPQFAREADGRSAARFAILRSLDRKYDIAKDMTVAVGEAAQLGDLLVIVDSCFVNGPAMRPDSVAHLRIADVTGENGAAPQIYSGWMFASAPGRSGLDHPRYDVWVASCTISAPDSAASSNG